MVAFDEGGDVVGIASLVPMTYNQPAVARGEAMANRRGDAMLRQHLRDQEAQNQAEQKQRALDAAIKWGRADMDAVRTRSDDEVPTSVNQAVQSQFGMNPDAERLTLLPRYDKEQGWVAPEMLFDAARGIVAPGVAGRGGEVSAEEALNLALNVAGTGFGASGLMRNPTGAGGKDLGMFIGPNATTWDKAAYDRALNLDAKGHTADEIKAITGMTQSPSSGRWSQLMSDKNSYVNPTKMPELDTSGNVFGYGARLGDVFHHPELYKAYPELKNVSIQRERGGGGAFDPNTSTIYIGDDITNPEKLRDVILHEIQHWVQDAEGFPRGGNTNDMMREIIKDPQSAARTNPLTKHFVDLYDLLVNERKAFGKYRNLEGEAQSRATEKTKDKDITELRSMALQDMYDVPVGGMDVRYSDGGITNLLRSK
jgi:hypothetical protein